MVMMHGNPSIFKSTLLSLFPYALFEILNGVFKKKILCKSC